MQKALLSIKRLRLTFKSAIICWNKLPMAVPTGCSRFRSMISKHFCCTLRKINHFSIQSHSHYSLPLIVYFFLLFLLLLRLPAIQESPQNTFSIYIYLSPSSVVKESWRRTMGKGHVNWTKFNSEEIHWTQPIAIYRREK